jgi:hypothetical protein
MAMDGGAGRGLVGLGVALGLALVASSWIFSQAVLTVRREGQTVEVKGFAERSLQSDLAVWTGSITTRGAELAEASQRLEAQSGALASFLAAQGVPDAEVELLPVQTQALFAQDEKGHATNRVEGYALTQQVRVTSADIDRVTQVSKNAAALIRQGIELSSWPPEYLYTKLEDLKISMLGEATSDARRRAEELARQSGSAIGPLRWARQGVFQITPAHSTEVSDYGRNDTTTREKSIKAVVTVGYAVGG